MKNIHALTALMAGFGESVYGRSITDGNRHHQNSARPGSVEETERLCTAQLKRERKDAKRLREMAGLQKGTVANQGGIK